MSTAEQKTKFIPLCVPELRGNEWKYVQECLDTNWISSVGSYVDRFERDLANYVGAKHAIATVNGTAALHVALLVAGVEPDHEVIVSTMSFIAPANAVRYAGAWPVFIDAEPHHYQMDPGSLLMFVERDCSWSDGVLRNKSTGRRVSAIVPVHILGHPVDMSPVLEIAQKYGLAVVEDATESLGARYQDRQVGVLGRLGCFSFNGNKLISTGGGGMIVTDDVQLAERARHLTTQAKADPIEYVHDELGFNYRLTNVLAAIGVAQLESVDEYIASKLRIAATYNDAFGETPGITVMTEADNVSSVYWMYTALIDEHAFGKDSRALLAVLRDAGIQTRPLWQPLHLSSPHLGAQKVGGQVAERLYRDALSLPCSVGLSSEDQERVIEAVLKACG